MNAEQIKQLRDKLELSQPAFAQKLGVSLNTVNRWERGKTRPSMLANNQLVKLLKSVKRGG